MSIWDDIEDIGEDIIDAAGDVGSTLGDVASSLFEGPGQLVGLAAAGAALFVVGTSAVIPVFIAGSVAGNALIRHRHMSDPERQFAEQVFGQTLPPNDRIVLTNLTGIKGRKFVCPNASGQALVNLGDAYDDPMTYQDDKYPAPGKLLIHELTHVWQIYHASFVPGLVCEGIANQLSGTTYLPGDGRKPWSEYNLEQQGTIVDEWFAPSFRGPAGFRPKRPEHPFYRFIVEDVRGEVLPRNSPMVSSGQAVARVFDHLDVFWIGPDGAIGSTFWDALPGLSWADHAPFPVTPPAAAQSAGLAVVSRRPDHLDVFWVGPDGGVGSTWWNMAPEGGWGDHTPFPIALKGAARSRSPVSAVARFPDHLDVFWIGPDGAIGSTFWSAAPGLSWADHAPSPSRRRERPCRVRTCNMSMHVADQSERNALCIQALYKALQNRDAQAATACYTENAYFEDIGFRLTGRQAIGRMWSLVCGAERLEVEFSDISAEGNRGRGFWIARYPPIIARPSRKRDKRFEVRNPSHSAFLFSADGLITDHRDTCDPKAWAAQAFPFPISTLMGNVGFLRRLLAGAKLARHSRQHPE